MLYLGMNGMLGWAWVTFLDCIGSLVSAQVDEGAPVYVTHAIPTPMHVLVRNGLPFHLYCLVRLLFFTNLNADAYFLSPYDGPFCLFFPQFLEYLPFGLHDYPIILVMIRQNMISQPKGRATHC